MSSVKENKLTETNWSKSPLDYIEDKFNNEGIEYELDWIDDGDYDVEFTIKDPNNVDRADDIICNEVGMAYEVVRDKNNNKKAFKVATYQDVIDRLNEELNKNYSLKGLTRKVVEAKETCSVDYLRYKKQLEKAKSIDDLRKVWNVIKKDLDADMSPEEDKHLSILFLDKKKELNEGLKEDKETEDSIIIDELVLTPDLLKEIGITTNEMNNQEEAQKLYDWLDKKYGGYTLEFFPVVKGNNLVLNNIVLAKEDDKLKEDKSVEDWLKPLFLCDRLERQDFISFAYEDQDDSVVATTYWETTPRKAHSDYIKTRRFLGDRYNVNVLRQENRDGNKEFAYVMRITPKTTNENLNEAKNNIPEKANLKKVLDRYNSNGKFAKQGNWKIARGGYDLAFQLYYDNLALIDGIAGEWDTNTRLELDQDTYGANDEYDVKDLANYICQVYTDCRLEENLDEAKGKLDDALPELEKYVNEYKDKLVEYGQALAKGEVARPDYKDFTTRFIFDIYYLFKRRGLNLGKYIGENELQDKYIGTLMKKALTNCGVKITKDEYLNESLDNSDLPTKDNKDVKDYIDKLISFYHLSSNCSNMYDEIYDKLGYSKVGDKILPAKVAKDESKVIKLYDTIREELLDMLEKDEFWFENWVIDDIKKLFNLQNISTNESLDTFNDKMDFLAKDEDEAIDGYKKVIKTVDNKNVKTQLKKIETEEKAHKDYLERVKKNKNIKYTEPLDEE